MYRVDRMPSVGAQIAELSVKASAHGIRQEFFHALRSIVQRLKSAPLEWGDPVYRTKKKGGLVCRGILHPLIVNYAVFELENVVVILTIRAMPRSLLQ